LKLIERRESRKWFRLNSTVLSTIIKKTRDISNQSSGSERRDDRVLQEKIIMVVQQDIL
jgi:hypothetical protein